MQSPIPTIPTIPTTADVAARLERLCRILAPLLCWAVAAVLTLAECCYQCGYQLGRAVHRRNDELARLWRHVCGVPAPTTATATAPVPAPVPVVPALPEPALHPLAAMAESLQSLTVSDLRRITGTRRKCRKAELITLALAMA
jgi:hypothetical protein